MRMQLFESCQLRMIVGLVEAFSPRVFFRSLFFSGGSFFKNSAAATRRSSCTKMLKVRHAAPKSITSKAMPCEANTARTLVGAALQPSGAPRSTIWGRAPGAARAERRRAHRVLSAANL